MPGFDSAATAPVGTIKWIVQIWWIHYIETWRWRAETRGMESRSMKSGNVKIERGSGNVFADLGLPDADAHLLKAELVERIDRIIRKRGLKQMEAAGLLGLSQPDVSRLLRGDFTEYSMERLLRLLTKLGRDVDIVIRENLSARQGRLRVGA